MAHAARHDHVEGILKPIAAAIISRQFGGRQRGSGQPRSSNRLVPGGEAVAHASHTPAGARSPGRQIVANVRIRKGATQKTVQIGVAIDALCHGNNHRRRHAEHQQGTRQLERWPTRLPQRARFTRSPDRKHEQKVDSIHIHPAAFRDPVFVPDEERARQVEIVLRGSLQHHPRRGFPPRGGDAGRVGAEIAGIDTSLPQLPQNPAPPRDTAPRS